VGLYLPVSTTTPIFVGGAVKWVVERTGRREEAESETGSGALFSSGLIAGGSLGGLALATVVGFHKEAAFAIGTRWFPRFAQSDTVALTIFAGLTLLLYFMAKSNKSAKNPG
jgi:nitric oxide reductase large subunit